MVLHRHRASCRQEANPWDLKKWQFVPTKRLDNFVLHLCQVVKHAGASDLRQNQEGEEVILAVVSTKVSRSVETWKDT